MTSRLLVASLAALSALGASPVGAQQLRDCLDVPGSAPHERPVEIRLRASEPKPTGGDRYFVHVSRAGGGTTVYVRPLDAPIYTTTFRFGERDGTYFVALARGSSKWPESDDDGDVVTGCAPQRIEITEREERLFSGTRTHVWAGMRLPLRGEAGASVFVKRLGIAGAIHVVPFKQDDNKWIGAIDVRWRGARGYLGGGVRYFPDKEAIRWRPTITAGEELPGWRGKPIWFVLDVRLDRSQWDPKAWRMLGYSFGVRIDLAGKRP